MSNTEKVNIKAEDLRTYLDIATRFRNHEFNIQMLRNAVFTGMQAILLAGFATAADKHFVVSCSISAFGIFFTVIWWLYYRSSLYWAWFWEIRCFEVNDAFLKNSEIDVNIFAEHPANSDKKQPPDLKFGGKTIKYTRVHNFMQLIQIGLGILWIVIFVGFLLLRFLPLINQN
jgi:hypothetical protein